MIKDALEYLLGLKEATIHKENDQVYSDQPLHLLKEPTPDMLTVNSLSSVVNYIQSHFDTKDKLMIHIESPTDVYVFSQVNANLNREQWLHAQALLPRFRFDHFYDTEEINIKLQSCFVRNDHRDIMLKIVGNIKEEAVRSMGDDGVSQAVTAKTGVATVGNVKVPNPVSLAPYRTFVEIKQPVSDFVFRMQNGPSCALFEADGGAWKLEAMNLIRHYFEEQLKTEIETGDVHIIA